MHTWSGPVQPHHRFLHRLGHGLEDGDPDDTSAADHAGLKRGVVQVDWPDGQVLFHVIERLGKAETEDTKVAGGVATGLDIEGTLSVYVIALYSKITKVKL